ncbi:MAG: sulfatase-like hydrolase/transferase [Verrucomicrobia bacterium]|nr:sulfatase-like hydrolase/transferase [Verrucomicrobiota bacterium]
MTTGKQRPDILWIVTTQWRAQATGFAGDSNARTPSLDALAARAINFTQAVTPHPFGPFARAALLTGVLSPENGVRDYFDPLPVGSRTVAHELRERGYETAFFGKWHLWKRDPSAALVGEVHAKAVVPPEARAGFDFWEGFESGFLLNDPWLHGTRLAEPTPFRGYQADVLCERTATWLTEQITKAKIQTPKAPERKPWFCMVSLESPHPPYDAPASGVLAPGEAALTLAANVPRGGEAETKARHELAGYYAHIEATDRAIGRLLKAVGDGVLVVFTSVHGDMHGAHGLFRKGWPYEESVRVPLLVWLPGFGAEVREDAVSLVDLAGMMTGFIEHGALPRIEAEAAHISMPSVVRLPHQCDRAWRGVRSKLQKRIFNPDGSAWLDFDLANDPGELKNRA